MPRRSTGTLRTPSKEVLDSSRPKEKPTALCDVGSILEVSQPLGLLLAAGFGLIVILRRSIVLLIVGYDRFLFLGWSLVLALSLFLR